MNCSITIGKVVLGQTLGCARCHDHKIRSSTYRRLITRCWQLRTTQVMEQRFMLGEQRVMSAWSDSVMTVIADEEIRGILSSVTGLRDKAKKADEAYALLRQGREELLDESELEKYRDALSDEALNIQLPPADRIAAQGRHVGELKKTISSPPPIPPRAMIFRRMSRNRPTNRFVSLASLMTKGQGTARFS